MIRKKREKLEEKTQKRREEKQCSKHKRQVKKSLNFKSMKNDFIKENFSS